MHPSDRQLVETALAGDLRGFERLVERHRHVVLRVAARIAGEADAEHVAQDAFLRAYHRLARWRGEGEFRTWLLRIAHNAALDNLASRHSAVVQIDDTLLDRPEAPERAPAARHEIGRDAGRLPRFAGALLC